MTEYRKFLKDWTSERGITSFLGSEKPEFQQDWKEEKKGGVRFGERIKAGAEREAMSGEDINRAGEPFKKPKPPDLNDEIEQYNEILRRYKKRVEDYENPPKQRQTARVKKEVEEEKDRLLLMRGNVRLSFDDITEPLYRYLEKLWVLKYGGKPLTNGDKSNLSERKIDKIFEKQMNDLLKQYGVERAP